MWLDLERNAQSYWYLRKGIDTYENSEGTCKNTFRSRQSDLISRQSELICRQSELISRQIDLNILSRLGDRNSPVIG